MCIRVFECDAGLLRCDCAYVIVIITIFCRIAGICVSCGDSGANGTCHNLGRFFHFIIFCVRI